MKIWLKIWDLNKKKRYKKTLMWFTDPEVMKYIGFYKKCKDFKTEKEALRFSRKLEGGIFYGIYFGNRLIGQTTLSHFQGNECEFGIIIGEKDCWGKGIGKEVTRQMLEKAQEMQIKKVVLTTASQNIAAQKVYEKVGFRHLKKIKNDRTIFLDNKWVQDDTVLMMLEL